MLLGLGGQRCLWWKLGVCGMALTRCVWCEGLRGVDGVRGVATP